LTAVATSCWYNNLHTYCLYHYTRRPSSTLVMMMMALMRNWPKIAFLSLAVVYCETGDTGTRHDQWCTPCPEQLASDEKQSNGRFLGQPSTVAGQVNGVDRRRDISSADHVLPRSSHSAIPRAGQRSEGTSIYHRAVGCSWLHLRRRCSGSLADGATVNGL